MPNPLVYAADDIVDLALRQAGVTNKIERLVSKRDRGELPRGVSEHPELRSKIMKKTARERLIEKVAAKISTKLLSPKAKGLWNQVQTLAKGGQTQAATPVPKGPGFFKRNWKPLAGAAAGAGLVGTGYMFGSEVEKQKHPTAVPQYFQ